MTKQEYVTPKKFAELSNGLLSQRGVYTALQRGEIKYFKPKMVKESKTGQYRIPVSELEQYGKRMLAKYE